MNLSEALAALDESLYSEVKPITRYWYGVLLRSLIEVLGDMEVTDITAVHLRHWRRVTFETPTSLGTVPSLASQHDYVTAVKRLFKWLHEEEVILKNPALRLENVTVPLDSPKAANPDDFIRLVRYFGSKRGGLRDLAILLFLFDTGCRVSTVCAIAAADIDFRKGRVWIHEKGAGAGKGRWVFFLPLTLQVLTQYQERLRPNVKHPHLFISRKLTPFTRAGIWHMLNTAGEKAGCEGPVNPHSWRHAFAIERLKAGQDLVSVSKMLGHANILITASYYGRFATDTLQEQHAKFSPLPGLTFGVPLDEKLSINDYVDEDIKSDT